MKSPKDVSIQSYFSKIFWQLHIVLLIRLSSNHLLIVLIQQYLFVSRKTKQTVNNFAFLNELLRLRIDLLMWLMYYMDLLILDKDQGLVDAD